MRIETTRRAYRFYLPILDDDVFSADLGQLDFIVFTPMTHEDVSALTGSEFVTLEWVLDDGATAISVGLIGIDTLYRAGRVTAKHVWHLLRLLVTDPKKAKDEMIAMGTALQSVATGAYEGVARFFLQGVRSYADLKAFIKTFGPPRNCAVFNGAPARWGSQYIATNDPWQKLFDRLFGMHSTSPVWAAGACSSLIASRISTISNNVDRFGSEEMASRVAIQVGRTYEKYEDRMDNMSDKTLDGLAEIIYQKLDAKKITSADSKTLDSVDLLVGTFSDRELQEAMEALSDLAAIAGDMPGYLGFVKKIFRLSLGCANKTRREVFNARS